MFSQRSSTVEVLFDKRFIDHRHAWRAVTVSLIKLPALHDGNFHVAEVTWSGSEHIDLQILARLRLISFDFRRAACTSKEPALYLVDESHRLHSGQSTNSLR